MHPAELGVEKNCRSYSCKPKTATSTNAKSMDAITSNISQSVVPEQDPHDQQKALVETVRNDQVIEYTKYEYPTSSQDLDYSLDYARYTTPLNLNMKKEVFIQQPDVNHLAPFTNDVHTDLSKMHFLYS